MMQKQRNEITNATYAIRGGRNTTQRNKPSLKVEIYYSRSVFFFPERIIFLNESNKTKKT